MHRIRWVRDHTVQSFKRQPGFSLVTAIKTNDNMFSFSFSGTLYSGTVSLSGDDVTVTVKVAFAQPGSAAERTVTTKTGYREAADAIVTEFLAAVGTP